MLRRRASHDSPSRFRAAALATSVFANNAPDLDFVYTGITSGRLGYLLHHRGHTHTLAAVLPLALLSWALAALATRLGPRSLSRHDNVTLAGLAVFGGLVHVSLDFCNNYGVHPFWPLFSGWFYGDAIFIVDPWLMLILTGMSLGVSASPILRGVLLASLGALLGIAWLSGLAEPGLALALTGASIAWVLALWGASFRARCWLGGSALLALALVLVGTRQVARASARDALTAGREPGLSLVDLVSTPAPGNPLCWTLLAVQASDDAYVVREGLASGWPWLSGARACRPMWRGQTAPVAPPREPAPDERRLVWTAELRATRARLARVREDCVARAFLRFARVPFWLERGDRPSLIGDLRFDRSSALEFAEIPLQPDMPCPRFEPPWLPPLALPAPAR